MTHEKCWTALDTGPSGTVIAVSRLNSLNKKDGRPEGEFLNAVLLKHCRDPAFGSPAFQQLIYESHTLFCRTQRQHMHTALKNDDILSLSLEYRSVIRSALSSAYNTNAEIYSTLRSWELIWSLVETVFFKPSTSSIVTDLLSWARISLARTDHVDELSECLRPNKINSLNKALFWRQVKFLILGGLFGNASSFLRAYEKLLGDAPAGALAEILGNIDILTISDEENEGDLLKLQRNIRKMVESGRFKEGSEALEIAMLIMGHRPTWKNTASLCYSWFELIPAYIYFFSPTASLEALPDIVKECTEVCDVKEDTEMDSVMRAVFSLDSLLVIQNVAKSSSNYWLVAHLSDLLHKANSSLMNACGVDARQYLVIEYGTHLFDEPGMWSLGFDYLKECGEEGKNRLELLVPILQIENEDVALKIVSLCCANDLEDLLADVQRSFTLRCLSMEHWTTALIWGMRVGDGKLLNTIANHILARCPPEVIAKMSVLGELSEMTLLSPSFLFLHKYYNYKKLVASGQKQLAAESLVDLIVSDHAPDKFSSSLFNDLVVILSFETENGPLLNKETTHTMLHYLSVCDLRKRFPKRVSENAADQDETLNALRFSLLNNLCKNFTA